MQIINVMCRKQNLLFSLERKLICGNNNKIPQDVKDIVFKCFCLSFRLYAILNWAHLTTFLVIHSDDVDSQPLLVLLQIETCCKRSYKHHV